jgi:hypothetical protein
MNNSPDLSNAARNTEERKRWRVDTASWARPFVIVECLEEPFLIDPCFPKVIQVRIVEPAEYAGEIINIHDTQLKEVQ